jgi:hypothetical protein
MKEDVNYFMGYATVPLYLCSCYLYEVENSQVIEDHEFDTLCVHIKQNFKELKHPHKKYIQYDSLASATASYFDWKKLPDRIISAAKTMLEEKKGE